MSKPLAKRILEAIKGHEDRLDNLETAKLFKTKTVFLATNLTVAANTAPATSIFDVPQIEGYKAIYVGLENLWNGVINLWYLYLNAEGTKINWRCRNNSNAAVSEITITARILYIKEEYFGGLV